MAQENILDVRENYNIGQTATVTGVVTSDDNLVRCATSKTPRRASRFTRAPIGAIGTRRLKSETASVSPVKSPSTVASEVGPNLTAVDFLGAGTLPNPLEITPAQMGESLEGQLVRINGVTFPLAGTFITGNNTYDFNAAGESGVIYVRTNALVGEELTGCEVDMLGIVSQFSLTDLGLPIASSRTRGFDSSFLPCVTPHRSLKLIWPRRASTCRGPQIWHVTEPWNTG